MTLAAVLPSCGPQTLEESGAHDFPGGDGKADVFGRGLVGVAADYPGGFVRGPDFDEADLHQDAFKRRQAAWDTFSVLLQNVPLLGISELQNDHEVTSWPDDELPKVPRFQTWYGLDDIKRMFQKLYDEQSPSERRLKKEFSFAQIEAAFTWNASSVERSSRWPLERYLNHVRALGLCPGDISDDACALLVQQKLSGQTSGTTRILYSPQAVRHILSEHAAIDGCTEILDSLGIDAEPASPDTNFSGCFTSEFPEHAVLVKAQWGRADFEMPMAAFDTDAANMSPRLQGVADWGEEGNRQVVPDAGDIYSIRLRDGSIYRLQGLHVMTKELRHWQWATLWWSDTPNRDFGQDRPGQFNDLPHVWSHYKMCAVSTFREETNDLRGTFGEFSDLAEVMSLTAETGEASWCSNPYIEHGRGNAGTNCIGCHQHGGAAVAYPKDEGEGFEAFRVEDLLENEIKYPDLGRSELRQLFPADYLYSLQHVDDLAGMMRREMAFIDHGDTQNFETRSAAVFGLEGQAEAGAQHFRTRCRVCHEPDPESSRFAPDLTEVLPKLSRSQVFETIFWGRGAMPTWADTFSNQDFADLLAFLDATYGPFFEEAVDAATSEPTD